MARKNDGPAGECAYRFFRARVAATFSVLVFAAAVALYPASRSAAQAAGKPEVGELAVGMLPIPGHAPIFVAQELGYLAQEGLKYTPQFGAGAQVLPLVIQGQLQIANIPILTGLQARAVARAVDYMAANDAQAKQLVAKFTKSKIEIVEGAGLPSFSNEWSIPNVQRQMELAVKYGLLDKPQNVSDLLWTTKR